MDVVMDNHFRRVSSSYHFDDHIYIGYDDGSLVQMDLNMVILSNTKTDLKCINLIFHLKDKLITRGVYATLLWDVTYPLNNWIEYDEDIYRNVFGGTVIGTMGCSIFSLALKDNYHATFQYERLWSFQHCMPSCLCISGDTIVVGTKDGMIFKVNHIVNTQLCIYDGTIMDIDYDDNVLRMRQYQIISICIWRDAIICSSAGMKISFSGIEHRNSVIRWKCISTDSYKPELFFNCDPIYIKIMDDQLFEFGSFDSPKYCITCWSWDGVKLRTIDFFPGFDGRGINYSLLIDGNICLFNGDKRAFRKSGTFNLYFFNVNS